MESSLNLADQGRIGVLRADPFNTEFIERAAPLDSVIPESLEIKSPLVQRHYLTNGELKPWDGLSEKVYSPIPVIQQGATVHPLVGEYPILGAKEAIEALQAAKQAYDRGLGTWPSMDLEGRIGCIERFVEKMQEKRSEVVKLIVWEIAKTESDAAKEFDRTVQYIKDSVTELRKMAAEDSVVRDREGISARVGRAPTGVVLCMGPFNYPLNETFTLLIPAIIMGNTTVVKTPKQGVLPMEPLLEAFRDSFPRGVVNVINGDGKDLITPIMQSGDVDQLAFIGSSRVAAILMKLHPAPQRMASPVLQLGAKNPAIVTKDANLPEAATQVAAGALTYDGQRCTALKIPFVQEDVAEEFITLLCAEVKKLPVGLPFEKDVKITPLAEPGKVKYLNELIEDAAALGARVVNQNGGQSEDTLYTPAVVFPVTKEMRLYKEEQFGPVVPVATFKTEAEVVNYIADSEYGQQVSIFTSTPDSAEHSKLISDLARVTGGRVNINTQCQRGPDDLPFGGRKDSASVALSLRLALEQFSKPTVVAAKSTDPASSTLAQVEMH